VVQDFQLQGNRGAEPQRIGGVIVVFIITQRVNQDVKVLPIEHQPGDNFSKRRCLEDDLPLRNGMRTGDTVVVPKLNREPRSEVLTYPISNGRATVIAIVDMRMIAVKLGHDTFLLLRFLVAGDLQAHLRFESSWFRYIQWVKGMVGWVRRIIMPPDPQNPIPDHISTERHDEVDVRHHDRMPVILELSE